MKIPASVKVIVFVASVICLSWFFAGYRAVCQVPSLSHWCLLLAGALTTTFTLGVQAWWIYMEEKQKGTLKRKIVLFEKICIWFERNTVKEVLGKRE